MPEASERKEIRVYVRDMSRRDMPDVLAIEKTSFEFPWTEEDFRRVLSQRNCVGKVAIHDDWVVGFMIYELRETEIHLLNLAVHSDYRRCAIGTQMMAKLISKLSSQRRRRIALEVGELNLGGQLFFQELGFRAVSVLRDFYENPAQDAYRMEYNFVSEAQGSLGPLPKDILARLG